MKKLLLIIAAMLLFVASVGAAPFLVSDPQPAEGIDYYEVMIDSGGWIRVAPEVVDTTSVRVALDLSPLNLANGMHTYVARACNAVWGCSANSVPLDNLKITPETPPGVDVVKDK